MKLPVIVLLLIFAPVVLMAQTVPIHRLTPVSPEHVVIEDSFWSPKFKVWEEVTLPDAWSKFENDRGGAINNFDRVRDGKSGDHAGPEWYDGLIYEMIRATADFLVIHPDATLRGHVEGHIARIAAAAERDPDGYINTWTQLMAPTHRWGLNGGNDVSQHDLYNAGALVEAGVHWYRATGETTLLKVAVRMANAMCALMGPSPKINQVPGHPLGEEAMVNLALLFREQPQLKAQLHLSVDAESYLKLAEFWIDHRGNHQGRPLDWGVYAQDDLPVCSQQGMEGHAVRDALLCAGVALAGSVTGRTDYITTAQRLWNDMVLRKMYVTGGLGAGLGIEGFGPDYYLPNTTAYAETCAAAAGGFFDGNMALAFADARYVDALERELFNAAMVGVSLKGDSYFYENPLEVGPQHVRWAWHPCPCCPPMLLKLMGAMPGYIYALETGAAYVNLFVGSHATLTLNGSRVDLHQTTRYPWDGQVKIAVEPAKPAEFDLFVRIPGWCQGTSSASDLVEIVDRPTNGAARLKVNGHAVANLDIVRGYVRLHRRWRAGDLVELTMEMPVRQIRANARVEADSGMVSLMRGPLVYCAEAVDNPTGIRHMVVSAKSTFTSRFAPDLLGGVVLLCGQVLAREEKEGKASLAPVEMTAIPYYASANRGGSAMSVWLPANPDKAILSTLATRSRASASHCWMLDSVDAINDGIVPAKSSDITQSRLSWWDHKGTTEWAQLDFPQESEVSKVRVFWFADRAVKGGCDLPKNWVLLYKEGDHWTPVERSSTYGVEADRFNEVTFAKVKTTALRIQVQLKPDWSGGICEWEVR